MESTSDIVGNPIALIIERVAYLGIGIFFVAALYRGVLRNITESKSKDL
mgnify:CR=1 FL=1|tara:strand:+ start:268 stop:414 length:147 start_codon:yes stop_codon:yes gene_type:complete